VRDHRKDRDLPLLKRCEQALDHLGHRARRRPGDQFGNPTKRMPKSLTLSSFGTEAPPTASAQSATDQVATAGLFLSPTTSRPS
jgi:hypothetical protein